MPQIFKREDLKYSYNWCEVYTEDKFVSPEDIIDRNNGYQMLGFFNRFAQLHGLISLSSLHRLEKLFCKYMPKEINTRSEIKLWLGKNWNRHFY
jgi:hypothetical protein